MLTIAICDDQQLFANKLEKRLEAICTFQLSEQIEYQVLPAFSSAKALLAYLSNHTIDILFLDIQMPVMNGFALASQLREQFPDMLLIFVSSYEERVYDSFAYSPFWFIRKPYLEQELPVIFQKAISRYLSDNESMVFQTKEGALILALKDILYFESDHNYYKIHCTSGITHKCRGALSAIAEQMQKYTFFHVHASYLINMAHIQQILPANVILMKNDTKIPISRHKVISFRESYSKYIQRRITL